MKVASYTTSYSEAISHQETSTVKQYNNAQVIKPKWLAPPTGKKAFRSPQLQPPPLQTCLPAAVQLHWRVKGFTQGHLSGDKERGQAEHTVPKLLYIINISVILNEVFVFLGQNQEVPVSLKLSIASLKQM